jgi:Nicotinate phosphoribosyltransferase (NAPRTase) N-terminal domain
MTTFDLLSLPITTFSAIEQSFATGQSHARTVFEYHMRGGPFFMVAGIERMLDEVATAEFADEQLAWLESQGLLSDGTRIHLQSARLQCNIDAVPEGTLVAPHVPFLAIEGEFWQAKLLADAFDRRIEAAVRAATSVARLRALAPNLAIIDRLSHLASFPAEAANGSELAGCMATTSLEVAYAFGTQLALREVTTRTSELAAGTRGGNLTIVPCSSMEWPKIAELTLDLCAQRASADLPALLIEVESSELRSFGPTLQAAFANIGLPAPLILAAGVTSLRDAELVSAIPNVHAIYSFFDSEATDLCCDMVAREADGRWVPCMRIGSTFERSADPSRKVLMRYADAAGSPIADVAHGTSERVQAARDVSFVERATGFSRTIHGATSTPLRLSMLRGGLRAGVAELHKNRLEHAAKAIAELRRVHFAPQGATPLPFGLSAALSAHKHEQAEKSTNRVE